MSTLYKPVEKPVQFQTNVFFEEQVIRPVSILPEWLQVDVYEEPVIEPYLVELSRELDESLREVELNISENSCLCGLAVYFNPADSFLKRKNFLTFSKSMRAQGIPLTVVELYVKFPEVNITWVDSLLQVKMDSAVADYPIWQKEHLLNIGLDFLTVSGETCRHVAWFDIEILHTNNGWKEVVCDALDNNFTILQPFRKPKRLSQQRTSTLDLSELLIANKDNPELILSERPLTNNHNKVYSGFAWAAQRELLEKVRFFPYAIVGGGDLTFISAIENSYEELEALVLSDSLEPLAKNTWIKKAYLKWAKNVFKTFENRVGLVHYEDRYKPEIYHLWHGNTRHRRYQERYSIIRSFNGFYDFNVTEKRYLRWSKHAIVKKPLMLARLGEYFTDRKETSTIISI